MDEAQIKKPVEVKKNSHLLYRLNRDKFLLLLALPTFLYLIIFRVTPLFGLYMAFLEYKPALGFINSRFVGFDQFVKLFTGRLFLPAFRNQVVLGVQNFMWNFPAPIILTLVINEVVSTRAKRLIQTTVYLPYFISIPVVCGLTIMFLNPTNGIINTVLGMFGVEPIYFMAKESMYRPIFIITEIWKGVGFGTVIYFAALAGIDPQLYESAVIDGANKWHEIIHITIPGLLPTIVVLFILRAGGIFNVSFEKTIMLQNTMNLSISEVLSTMIWKQAFERKMFSFSVAAGIFDSILAGCMVYVSNYLSRSFTDHNLF